MKNIPESMPQEYAKGYEGDPTRLIKFGDYEIGQNNVAEIAGVSGPILTELFKVFGESSDQEPTVDNLGKLIGIIGPAKALQKNLPKIGELLPGQDGKELAIGWVEASGLLEPVFRNYENPDALLPKNFDKAVLTGGVRNWMMRRAKILLEQVSLGYELDDVTLVAGTRAMKNTEGSDVIEGDTEASYMERVIKPILEEANLKVEIVKPDTANGDEIAKVVAAQVKGAESLLLACNAGNWIQNGGQIRRAISSDINKLFVVSDGFPVAKNGEPAATHQNPLTAVGIIARNLQELLRQESR